MPSPPRDDEVGSPPAPARRPRLTDGEISRIRSERLRPAWTLWDYLHLRGLRDALVSAFDRLPVRGIARPVLDLYCGAKPYEPLIPLRPVVGYDIDDHFGGADVIGGLPLVFADHAFSLVICTQALHLVDDPQAVVAEMGRVLATDGWALVTVPTIFRRDLPYERKLRRQQLTDLFNGWLDVQVDGIRGPGTGVAYIAGKVLVGAARRWRWLRPAVPAAALVINVVGSVLDWLTRPLWRRYPAALLLTARPPT